VTCRSRRRFLGGAAAAAGGVLAGRVRLWAGQAPAIVTADAVRPAIPSGTSAGDVTAGRATVWSRTDRPARMVVEYATTDSFADARRVVGPAALEETGFTARVELTDLPAGQHVAYRVLFQDLGDLKTWSRPAAGRFRTPAARANDVLLAWSADTAGQGWGINPDGGGMRLYETMRRAEPHVFIHVGDTIYADQPMKPEVTLDDGTVWRNLVTPSKAKVAETLDEFRGNHLYNLLDENVRRFNADVAQIVLWDDHEVHDNWYPTEVLEDDPRYQVKSVALLAARAKRAFFEHHPIRLGYEDAERVHRAYTYGPAVEIFALDMRSYRGANSPNRQATLGPDAALLGAAQVEWLKRGLAASPATWKVIASDMPLGLVVRDGPADFEAVANADDGAPRGRELEIAGLLRHLRDRRVRNVVWVTGDVHYCAAHHYDPSRARFTEFDPFWEFVAGPLHAGTFGPNALDATFGPEVRFVGIPPGMKPNRPPSAGLQFFGTLAVAGRSRVLTVRLHDLSGKALFTLELAPQEV
jgi:alkaline phosphatase D